MFRKGALAASAVIIGLVLFAIMASWADTTLSGLPGAGDKMPSPAPTAVNLTPPPAQSPAAAPATTEPQATNPLLQPAAKPVQQVADQNYWPYPRESEPGNGYDTSVFSAGSEREAGYVRMADRTPYDPPTPTPELAVDPTPPAPAPPASGPATAYTNADVERLRAQELAAAGTTTNVATTGDGTTVTTTTKTTTSTTTTVGGTPDAGTAQPPTTNSQQPGGPAYTPPPASGYQPPVGTRPEVVNYTTEGRRKLEEQRRADQSVYLAWLERLKKARFRFTYEVDAKGQRKVSGSKLTGGTPELLHTFKWFLAHSKASVNPKTGEVNVAWSKVKPEDRLAVIEATQHHTWVGVVQIKTWIAGAWRPLADLGVNVYGWMANTIRAHTMNIYLLWLAIAILFALAITPVRRKCFHWIP